MKVIVQFQLQNSYDVDSDPEVIVILQFLHLYTLQFSIYITGSTSFFYIFCILVLSNFYSSLVLYMTVLYQFSTLKFCTSFVHLGLETLSLINK